MVKWMRTGYLISVWLFLLGVLAQTFLAGLALFSLSAYWKDHTSLGWLVAHGLPILPLLFALFSRLPRDAWGMLIILLILAGIQPFLPGLRRELPWAAALHPVNALLLFWIGLKVARRARDFVAPPLGTGSAV